MLSFVAYAYVIEDNRNKTGFIYFNKTFSILNHVQDNHWNEKSEILRYVVGFIDTSLNIYIYIKTNRAEKCLVEISPQKYSPTLLPSF